MTNTFPNPADAARAIAPGQTVKKITLDSGNDLPGGTCRSVCCGTAGTFNFIDADGNDCANYPLQQGYNPIGVKRAKAGGSATDIWAIY
jgi:hypothetical protein